MTDPPDRQDNPEKSEAPEIEESVEPDGVGKSGEETGQPKATSDDKKSEHVDYYTQLKQLATIIADKLDTDVIIYNGDIDSPHDRRMINLCSDRKNRTNVYLIMVTGGGDPNAAFRIARHLQLKYEKIFFCASGLCKSSGTLVAIGADDLIISDHGELGPLDVQIYKKDRLGEMQSGWTADSAIKFLLKVAFSNFQKIFFDMVISTRRTITVPTASKIAADLSIGLIAPIIQQIDPMHVGEMSRALDIAIKYGRMLSDGENRRKKGDKGEESLITQIIDDDGLKALISGYPSHDFVIDREEASKLFKCVRKPEVEEQNLLLLLGRIAIEPMYKDDPLIDMLSNPKPEG